ncbi:ELM1/GtrOC1 family putative glycosyltransferase [Sessilibacter corallicola]|uniref:ELM1/GtrOC1 family putative glycosyltransferase n=1 Tax=Sessilibacter corallicola TaxID=2904075 RepID=A0ABQ0A582_9GAMM
MRILIIYDGKPGHLSQSLGLANLIVARTAQTVSIDHLIAKPEIKLLNRLLRRLSVIDHSIITWIVKQAYRADIPKARPDLIVSFGGNVIALNIALRNYWKANNIVIGNCYSIPSQFFDAQITMFGEENHSKNIASFVALSGISRKECLSLGKQLNSKYSNTRHWAMLIGGNGSGYEYTEDDFHHLGRSMAGLSYRYGIKWLVTTSRRTDVIAEIILRKYLTHETTSNVCFYNSGENSCIKSIVGASERIFCTEDSLSMLSESVSLAKPVISVKPEKTSNQGIHRKTVDRMTSIGLIDPIEIHELSTYQPTQFAPEKSYDAHLEDIYQQTKQRVIKANHVRTPAFMEEEITAQ